jgi:hypothetical protein
MSGLGLPILTYHALDRSGGVTSTDPSWFAETIDRLVSAGLVGVDLSDWIAQGRPAINSRRDRRGSAPSDSCHGVSRH